MFSELLSEKAYFYHFCLHMEPRDQTLKIRCPSQMPKVSKCDNGQQMGLLIQDLKPQKNTNLLPINHDYWRQLTHSASIATSKYQDEKAILPRVSQTRYTVQKAIKHLPDQNIQTCQEPKVLQVK